MKLIDRLFLGHYVPGDTPDRTAHDYRTAGAFVRTLLLLIPLMLSVTLINPVNAAFQSVIFATAGILTFRQAYPLEVYMLGGFHLFLIFTAALVSCKKRDIVAGGVLTLASLTTHFILRSVAGPMAGLWPG